VQQVSGRDEDSCGILNRWSNYTVSGASVARSPIRPIFDA